MNRKKIVVLSAFYEPYMSGAEQMVKEVVERLGMRHNITLVTGRFDKKLPVIENRSAFKLIRVGIGHPQIDKILYPFLAAWKCVEIKPEVVHAIMESYAGGALLLVKYLYPKAKRILTLQSGDLDSDRKQKQLALKIVWSSIHRAPHIVTAISNFLADRARKLGVKDENLIVLPNGIDLSSVPSGIEKINDRIVCVARLSWEKGLDYLIKGFAEVVKKYPAAQLVMVGEGKERGEIEKMISELNLSESVVLFGNLPHDQVLVEICKSEIFICPSLAEGLGIVFIEAQACGVPPIGTRVGGISDVITDGVDGLLIEAKNSEQITLALLKLLRDKELTSQMSINAKNGVKRFNWHEIIEKVEELYN